MVEVSQANFNRAEEIAASMWEQGGLSDALRGVLDGKICQSVENTALALIEAQEHCRTRASRAAMQIARSGSVRAEAGKEPKP